MRAFLIMHQGDCWEIVLISLTIHYFKMHLSMLARFGLMAISSNINCPSLNIKEQLVQLFICSDRKGGGVHAVCVEQCARKCPFTFTLLFTNALPAVINSIYIQGFNMNYIHKCSCYEKWMAGTQLLTAVSCRALHHFSCS